VRKKPARKKPVRKKPVRKKPRRIPVPKGLIFGMRTRKASLRKTATRYVLTVGKRRMQIHTGPLVSARELNRLVGKPIHAAISRKRPSEVVAIGLWPKPPWPPRPPRCYWILCYYPGPDAIRRIDPIMRRTAIRSMVTKGIITDKLGREIARGMRR
jgi:hypothetical protein